MQVAPIDLIELVKVIFYGVATLCVPLATVYIMLAAARTKRAEEAAIAVKADLSKVRDNVELIERNTNSLSTRMADLARKNGIVEGVQQGIQRGVEAAQQLAEGQRRGIEIERASVAAQAPTTAISSPPPAAELKGHVGQDQVPVKDDRVAAATERIARATEKSVDRKDKTP